MMTGSSFILPSRLREGPGEGLSRIPTIGGNKPSPNPSRKREGKLFAPPRLGRLLQPRLGDDLAHPRAEMLEAHFLVAERPHAEAFRLHALLDAGDERGVLGIDLAVDAPVEVARGLHLAAFIGEDRSEEGRVGKES